MKGMTVRMLRNNWVLEGCELICRPRPYFSEFDPMHTFSSNSPPLGTHPAGIIYPVGLARFMLCVALSTCHATHT